MTSEHSPSKTSAEWANWLESELGHQDGWEVIRFRKEHVRSLIASLRATDEPPVRRCNHGAISPKGTMFYHGFVSNRLNQWRCDVCRGIYEGNLTEPMNPGSHALTLMSEPPAATHFAFLVKRARDSEPWPTIFTDRQRAEEYPDRASPVAPVCLSETKEVRHAVTCKLFPDPHDERDPVGPCTCGASAETSARTWLIRKGGYYYRPDRAGYTSSIADAGRYTEAEAKAEAAIEPAIMQAVATKECSYCFGEGTVSLSTGDRMLCSLCGGGGVTVSEAAGNDR